MSDDLADAKRYRYLRDSEWDQRYDDIISKQGDDADEWDRLIDEEVARKEK